MSDSSLINPILDDKYSSLRISNDPNAKQIVNSATSIYNNIIIFSTSNDVPALDNSILDIQDKFNDLISLATPCSSISNADKCSTPICNFVSDIEKIYLDLFIMLSGLTAFNQKSKENYSFITFFMTYYFSNMVISNPNNQNRFALPKVQYLLCSGTTYQPAGLTPSQTTQYNALMSRMTKQRTTTVVRQETNNSKQFLLYILLPTVVFIILVLLYIKHVKQAAIQDNLLKNAVTPNK
jgi:hypothetical protein